MPRGWSRLGLSAIVTWVYETLSDAVSILTLASPFTDRTALVELDLFDYFPASARVISTSAAFLAHDEARRSITNTEYI
jgi:hypothetical protein